MGTSVKTYEVKMDRNDEEYLAVPHFMAYYDDDGRMCMLVNVNNDIADGFSLSYIFLITDVRTPSSVSQAIGWSSVSVTYR